MEYFITEAQRKQRGGSCYFEFRKGRASNPGEPLYWREDSLLLHADIADEIALYKIVPGFQYYGETTIGRDTWEIIRENAGKAGTTAENVIAGLSGWAEENFREYEYFVICGI